MSMPMKKNNVLHVFAAIKATFWFADKCHKSSMEF